MERMNRTRFAVLAIIVATVLGGAGLWAQSSSTPRPLPVLGALAATPTNVVINSPSTVTFTIPVSRLTQIRPLTIELQRVDAGGQVQSATPMNDAGQNGDLKAGDRTFTTRLQLNELSPGRLHFRATATYPWYGQAAVSNAVYVDVDPFALPPDPGEAGKQTLEGIDSDNDGVRDDVQRYIANRYTRFDDRAALTQYARALQGTMEPQADPLTVATKHVAAVYCIFYVFRDEPDPAQVSAALRSEMLNTVARIRAYATLRESAPYNPVPPGLASEDSAFCES